MRNRTKRTVNFVPVDEDWLSQVKALLTRMSTTRARIEVDNGREIACALCGQQQTHPGSERHDPTCIIRQASQLSITAATSPPALTDDQERVIEAIRRHCSSAPDVAVGPGIAVVKPVGPVLYIVLPSGETLTGRMDSKPPLRKEHWL